MLICYLGFGFGIYGFGICLVCVCISYFGCGFGIFVGLVFISYVDMVWVWYFDGLVFVWLECGCI